MVPITRTKTVDNSIPPFLYAIPIANSPHPIFPFIICVKVSKYLKIELNKLSFVQSPINVYIREFIVSNENSLLITMY